MRETPREPPTQVGKTPFFLGGGGGAFYTK
eukprot:COSAG06_NODE_62880_length_264_cov_0.315152_1_plen_29_part_01